MGVRSISHRMHRPSLTSGRMQVTSIHLNTRTHREIEYPGEYFGSFSWLNTNTLAFSTLDGRSLTYWRGEIGGLPNNRVMVHTESFPNQDLSSPPPELRQD